MRLFGGAGGSGSAHGTGGDPPRPANGPPSESVTQLAARIKGALESLGDPIRVRGEISNFLDKGHWYFSLKDEGAVVGCAMWQEQARRVGWTPKEGDAVVATGSVSFFAKQGRAQFYVRSIERVGVGSLQERYEALCRELRGLGYFEESRKRPLPSFPRRVAIVTSATGAAIHDCLRTAAHRCPAVGLVLVDVRVQGDGSAKEVARAVTLLDRHAAALGIDAILVTRGGGSIEDLWAFNEREVADAVFARRRVPIVAAIGHESDTTIVELVADRRASTPTQAMMLLTPDRAELAEQVESLADRLVSSLRRSVRERRELLARTARHAFLRSPLAPLVERRRRLEEVRQRLVRATQSRVVVGRGALERGRTMLESLRPALTMARARQDLADQARRLERAAFERLRRAAERTESMRRQLEAVAPERVLARGYSYTMTTDGRLVRHVADAPTGTLLETRLVDGTVRSRVEEHGALPARPSRPTGVSSPKGRGPAAGSGTFDLFGEAQ
jgi:exodeoxyribonuclease VII large subunit